MRTKHSTISAWVRVVKRYTGGFPPVDGIGNEISSSRRNKPSSEIQFPAPV